MSIDARDQSLWFLTRALYIHEIRVRRLYEALQFVLLLLRFDGGVKQIDRESLFVNSRENGGIGEQSRHAGCVSD